MTGPRVGIAAGLLYGIPFTFWLLGQAQPGTLAPDLSAVVPVLAGCQALILLVLMPMGGCADTPGYRLSQALAAAAMLIMVPWPVPLLALGTGTVNLAELGWTQAAVALWALLLEGTGRLTRRLPDSLSPSAVATLRGLALLVLLALFDLYRTLPGDASPPFASGS
jgi:hypothetical protein